MSERNAERDEGIGGAVNGAPRDLRYSEHQDGDVHIQRDLSGPSMFLAVGSHTRYHQISFSLRPASVEAQSAPSPPASADTPKVGVEPPAASLSKAGDAQLTTASLAPSPEGEQAPSAPTGLMSRLRSWLGS